MTREQILENVEDTNLTEIGRIEFKDFYSDLVINNVQIGDFYFDIFFQMGNQSHTLEHVLIKCEMHSNEDPSPIIDECKTVLSERYKPVERLGTSDQWMICYPTTSILLTSLLIDDDAYWVSIIFMRTSEAQVGDESAAF